MHINLFNKQTLLAHKNNVTARNIIRSASQLLDTMRRPKKKILKER